MSENSEDIRGMTVNERLMHFGLLTEFDAAVQTGQIDSVIAVLLRARFTRAQADFTASTVLAKLNRQR